MILHIRGGVIKLIYNETLDLRPLGKSIIQRASHVEPNAQGEWEASIVGGPVLGPFTKRSDALAAEMEWLEQHI